MGRGGHGHGHSDDDDVGGTPYDQSLEELEFMRSACSAAQRGQTEKLRGMLDKKPESLHWDGVAGNSGYTPLHYAAREGQVDCVRLLLERGALVNSKTTAGGATPLHRAAFTGKTEICRLLCALLAAAATMPVADALKLRACLMKLHGVCCLRLIRLRHGADQMIQDADGQTAYFKACAQGQKETAAMLLEACPDVAKVVDSKGDLPPPLK